MANPVLDSPEECFPGHPHEGRMLIGYARVSTATQDPQYQRDALEAAGCERIYVEHALSGAARDRPELARALEQLRPGDSLVAWRLDRIARSTLHLVRLAGELEEMQCQLVSLTERIDTRSPHGKLFFTLLAAFAQMERDLTVERTRAAAEAARRAGKRWGRPATLADPKVAAEAKRLLEEGKLSKRAVARQLGISSSTLYNWFPKGDPNAYDGKLHTAAARRKGAAH